MSGLDFWRNGAEFSPDRRYRYRLWRCWGIGPMLMVIGLNPSTADEATDDPTVRRCVGYAQAWGFAGLRVLNVSGFRSTDPLPMLRSLRMADDYEYRQKNLNVVRSEARITIAEGGAVLAAWGAHGARDGLGEMMTHWLERDHVPVACLGLTKDKQPKHPLYLPKNAQPLRFLGNGGILCKEPTP